MHILEELLHPIPFETFRRSHLFTTPFAEPFKARGFTNFVSWPMIQRILSVHANCWLPKQGLLPADPETSTGRLSMEQAQSAFANGRTVLIRHAEDADPAVAAVARDFHELFGQPIDVQLYLTPKGEEGFDWHYDVEEVFVIQCRGEKEFRLRRNTIDPWPQGKELPKDLKFERERLSPETRCTLKAGDWLYIPAGYWHKGQALTDSFHMSVGVKFDQPVFKKDTPSLPSEKSRQL